MSFAKGVGPCTEASTASASASSSSDGPNMRRANVTTPNSKTKKKTPDVPTSLEKAPQPLLPAALVLAKAKNGKHKGDSVMSKKVQLSLKF